MAEIAEATTMTAAEGVGAAAAAPDNIPVGLAWLAFMFYIMLFCQHRICEAYFVPALNVLMDSMGSKKNPWLKRLGNPGVAGATFMALGANGPELFTNLFSLFSHSDGGIGVVIGSEIFNLLVIIGASIVATKQLPLKLEKVPFARDVLYYALSIALLLWALYYNGKPGEILKWEAGVMLIAALSYWTVVYFTADIAEKVFGIKEEGAASITPNTKIRGVAVEVEQLYHSRMADGHGHQGMQMNMDVMDAGIMTDFGEVPKGGRQSVGFQVAKDGALLGDGMLMYKELTEVVVVGEGMIHMTFQKSDLTSITLKVKCENAVERGLLLENLEKHAHDDNVTQSTWIHKYDATCKSSIDNLKHHFAHGGVLGKIHAVLEFFIDFLLSSTLFWCDVKDVTKESRWIPCFMGAMFWLAFFSWLMVQVMSQISANISILSPMLLGVTVGAIGTSLPNAMGSIMMAQQGKSAAAIGNAFGSNVQNVFLAMAGPWMIYLISSGDHGVMNSLAAKGQSVGEGVDWMLGTLVLVVFFAIIPQTCTLSKAYGMIFLVVYAFYLVWTIYEFLTVK